MNTCTAIYPDSAKDTALSAASTPDRTLRPREKLLAQGPAALSNAELLAILLRTGSAQLSIMQFSQYVLEQAGGPRNLLLSNYQSLRKIKGLGDAKICSFLAAVEFARRHMQDTMQYHTVLDRPTVVRDFCISLLSHEVVEKCLLLLVNTRHQLIHYEEASRGTLNQTAVYPREIAATALRHHAWGVILAHNHPSGLAEPSLADIQLTQQLRRGLALLDIRLIDHIIVAGGGAISLAERGKL
ncbi:RadC family protein [Advenella mimigardefordensis]|uniref:Putative RadC-like protein n=1 Tax=Advenella mimigardefordensis (strain DSM 17166 / LMG 22922 / DPN7) TaxID=1247726 RepID=W0PC12_ADVMD|nr:DNA repair protein RadC [Advenella mimigardefordensis]AHG64414.1 putative RadC-like protein [Advenella mimigardefordensis DPN7]